MQDIYDKGSEQENPLSSKCSAIILSLLKYIGIRNICVVAHVVLVNDDTI